MGAKLSGIVAETVREELSFTWAKSSMWINSVCLLFVVLFKENAVPKAQTIPSDALSASEGAGFKWGD